MIASITASAPLSNQPLLSSRRCLSSLAQSIGTSVSDTTAEITMVTASVIANSWNKRPTMSPMKSSGISTAISDTVSEMMVKPICSEPLSAAASGSSPSSMKRAMFSIMTIASSTTKPVETVSAMSDRLSRLKPSRYMTTSVPTSESGQTGSGSGSRARCAGRRRSRARPGRWRARVRTRHRRSKRGWSVVRSLITSMWTAAGRLASSLSAAAS